MKLFGKKLKYKEIRWTIDGHTQRFDMLLERKKDDGEQQESFSLGSLEKTLTMFKTGFKDTALVILGEGVSLRKIKVCIEIIIHGVKIG